MCGQRMAARAEIVGNVSVDRGPFGGAGEAAEDRKGEKALAIFHLSAQVIGKGSGRSAVAAAAYRHCAKMEREETAEEIDYSRKGGNAHSEFALPKDAPVWIADFACSHTAPETSAFFWNAVETSEARRDVNPAPETSTKARFAVEAPVTIFRVYWV